MDALEQQVLLVVSTAHIERRDADQLASYADSETFPPINAGVIADTQYGYLLWIGSEGPVDDQAQLLAEAGFSPALARVIAFAYAQALGFFYLLIDRDCEAIDALPAYHW